MGREIWIYKSKPEKVTTGLRKLQYNEYGFSPSFENFLSSRQNKGMLATVHKNSHPITPELVFEITFWLSEEIDLNDIELNRFLTNEIGLSLIFESSTKSEANGFMIFYHDYLDAIQENKGASKTSEAGVIMDSFDFLNFLDYFILFLNGINSLIYGSNHYTSEMNWEIEKIFTERNKEEHFIKQLKSELKKFKSLYTSDPSSSIDSSLSTQAELELINRNFEFLSKSIAIKRKIPNKNEMIIIVDSK